MKIFIFPMLAFACTFAALSALLRWRHRLPLDQPNERSLHTNPIPRIGGLGMTPVILLFALLSQHDDSMMLTTVIGTVLVLAISLLDDFIGLPALPRLMLHLAVAVSVPLLAGVPLPLACGIALAIAWMTNLYNFMDGSNGLAGGMAVIGFSGYAIGAHLAGDSGIEVFSLLIVGAALAFLRFNFGKARMFLGDAGSIPLGFLAGVLGFMGLSRGLWPAWFPFVMFSVFFVDASLTLSRRLLRRERVWEAHREHAYQRLICSGWSHARLAVHAYGLMVLSVGLGLLAAFGPARVKLPCFGLLALVFLSVFCWIERRALR